MCSIVLERVDLRGGVVVSGVTIELVDLLGRDGCVSETY